MHKLNLCKETIGMMEQIQGGVGRTDTCLYPCRTRTQPSVNFSCPRPTDATCLTCEP